MLPNTQGGLAQEKPGEDLRSEGEPLFLLLQNTHEVFEYCGNHWESYSALFKTCSSVKPRWGEGDGLFLVKKQTGLVTLKEGWTKKTFF